jgi:hypothetical protein
MRSMSISLALLVAACTGSNPAGPNPNETCSAQTNCNSTGGFRSCSDGTHCRLLASDGTSFACTSCNECTVATTQVTEWCAAGSSTSGVQLSIGNVASPASIGAVRPSAGRYFLTVAVTLINLSVPTPVPAALLYYRLASTGGLTLTPAAASGAVGTPCPADVSVNTGGQFSCTLAFEVPTGDKPATLNYDDTMGHKASAPVTLPATPMDPGCVPYVTGVTTGSSTCKACYTKAQQSGGVCYTLVQMYTSTCNATIMSCACKQTDPTALCDCEHACFTTDCASQLATIHDCLIPACASSCP